jgi:hypothetical protein
MVSLVRPTDEGNQKASNSTSDSIVTLPAKFLEAESMPNSSGAAEIWNSLKSEIVRERLQENSTTAVTARVSLWGFEGGSLGIGSNPIGDEPAPRRVQERIKLQPPLRLHLKGCHLGPHSGAIISASEIHMQVAGSK